MSLLKNKTALVTGGSRGIGKGIAIEFLKQGANVALTYSRSPEAANALLKELEPYKASEHAKIRAYQADAGSLSETRATIQKVLADFSSVDILINNAGITRDNLLLRLSEEDWDKVINTNLKSVFNYCKHVAPIMLKARAGSIINVSSIVGLQGNAGQCNYAAAKAGIVGFSKALARELAGRGIRVNVIAPGAIQTDMMASLPEEAVEKWTKSVPLKRMGVPSDIANAALFFASDMSAYVTGQVLSVCGGVNI